MSTATLEQPQQTQTVTPTRDARYRSFVPPDELALYTAMVVGVGAIGRHVAMMLAGIGCPRIVLVDHDKVELVNLNPQGWAVADLDRYKVEAAADAIRAHNPDLKVWPQVSRFGRAIWSERELLELHKPEVGDKLAVFCCVDQMAARTFVWNECQSRADFWVDGRMGGEQIRILTIQDPENDEYYATTLFADSAAEPAACTAQSTNYTSAFAAAHMVGQFTKHLRDHLMDRDFMHSIAANEIFPS